MKGLEEAAGEPAVPAPSLLGGESLMDEIANTPEPDEEKSDEKELNNIYFIYCYFCFSGNAIHC